MKRSCRGLVLAAVLQVILELANADTGIPLGPPPPHDVVNHGPRLAHPYLERIPKRCWAPPAGIDIYQCCPIPRLYPDEVMESCGIQKAPLEEIPAPAKSVPDRDCKKGICLMTHSNLLKENGSIEYDKLRVFIDNWASNNPNFTEAIQIAKSMCARDNGPPSPFNICEPDKVFFCLTANILWNCKLRVEFESCQILQEHMDDCRPYYAKPKDQNIETVRKVQAIHTPA